MENKYRAKPQDCLGDYPNCKMKDCSRYAECLMETEKRNTKRLF